MGTERVDATGTLCGVISSWKTAPPPDHPAPAHGWRETAAPGLSCGDCIVDTGAGEECDGAGGGDGGVCGTACRQWSRW